MPRRTKRGRHRLAVSGITFGTESSALIHGRFANCFEGHETALGFSWQSAALGIIQSLIGYGHPFLREIKILVATRADLRAIAQRAGRQTLDYLAAAGIIINEKTSKVASQMERTHAFILGLVAMSSADKAQSGHVANSTGHVQMETAN